ncbi:MAG: gamma carbonic anhydrase family protein [Fusobacteriaceae bacterium]
MIYKLGNKIPVLGENNFVAETSAVIGNVVTGKNVSIWFSAVIRGDSNSIKIGDNVSVQDNTTIHTDVNSCVNIGSNVAIGHNCVIHGCEIGNNVVIGMGSTILNGVKIPSNSIVAAGSVVTEKLKAKEGRLILGSPAKDVKYLSEENIKYIEFAYKVYLDEIEKYKNLEKIK